MTEARYTHYRVVHDDISVYRQIDNGHPVQVYRGEEVGFENVVLSEEEHNHLIEIPEEEAKQRERGA